MLDYRRRFIDLELDALLPHLGAISLEGPKGVGKTASAERRAATTYQLEDPIQRELLAADPARLSRDSAPILIDEWQRLTQTWDLVRREVDRDPSGGRFLLTGSASPLTPGTHSGAGRIVRLRMRPLTLAERGPGEPTVSLAGLLVGDRALLEGQSNVDLVGYADHIVASGFPAIHPLPDGVRGRQLDGYLDRIVDTEFPELGRRVLRPATLRAWLAAYAAATSTTTSYNAILDAATPGESDKPAKTTTIAYRDVLTRLWLLDPVPGWLPSGNRFARLASGPKHHLADPALAARLLNCSSRSLLSGAPRHPGVDGGLLGPLFESLVTLCVRVYAQVCDATVHHLRTGDGDHEIDLIVQGDDGRVVAIEVKLAPAVDDRDVRHLRWLASRLGENLADALVVTTGPYAYRRADGIAVVPAALLGP